MGSLATSVLALLGLGLTARELFQAPVPPPNFFHLPRVGTRTPLGVFWVGISVPTERPFLSGRQGFCGLS